MEDGKEIDEKRVNEAEAVKAKANEHFRGNGAYSSIANQLENAYRDREKLRRSDSPLHGSTQTQSQRRRLLRQSQHREPTQRILRRRARGRDARRRSRSRLREGLLSSRRGEHGHGKVQSEFERLRNGCVT